MEYSCPKCKKLFRPHTFMGVRHPSQVKCPDCKTKGKITVQGLENRRSRFAAINQDRYTGV